jgi:hypothetical protein
MKRWRHISRRLVACLALLFWILATIPVVQAETRLSPDEARKLAGHLLQTGRLLEARDLAMGLLRADRKDVAALIIVSQAERVMGKPDVARDAGAAAWAFATTPAQRYAAAVVTAQALASSKNYTSSQVWLRRAAQNAPNDVAGQLVARDYARLRLVNPYTLSFGAKISPSSNVNNGSANRTTTFEGIPFVFTLSPEARALSGVEVALNAGLKYRLTSNPQSATHLTFELYGRQVAFSAKSKADAPDADPKDYAFSQATLGIVHMWKMPSSKVNWTTGVAYGRSHYGGAPYTGSGQIYLTGTWDLPGENRFAITAGAEKTTYLASDRQSESLSFKAVWTKNLTSGRALTLSLGFGDTKSSRVTGTFTELSMNAKYSLGEVIKGLDLTMSYNLEQQHYPVAGLISGARNDLRHVLGAEFGLKKAGFYGFEPVLSFEASKNISNVDLYDSVAVKVGFNLRSKF